MCGAARVLFQMIRQVLLTSERLLTEIAAMRRLASVNPDMIGQVFLSGKCFCAEGTFVGRFSCVKVHVVREVLLTRERL